jgi:hypothetical protein
METESARMTYTVEVEGLWLDPMTMIEAPRTERFKVLAGHRGAAETAAYQLFGSASARERCRAVGDRTAKAG